ncbi:MAG: hypothetical protein IJ517_02755 [Alphaproteobacteria bacterium]|nr:hypothetical protein [Alphaproteobacteria bacterium]
MKKNLCSCLYVVIAFVVGFLLGMWTYASRDALTPSDMPMCDGGAHPDKYGCCPGEVYTDMADLGFNCCPEIGGDCFPPLR